MRLLLVALSVIGLGCSAPERWCEASEIPDECRAEAVVWTQGLGMTTPAPRVIWHHELCPGHDKTAAVIGGACYAGIYLPQRGEAHVAWRGSIRDSAYCHELLHAWQGRHGIYDPDHLRAQDWALEVVLNARLAEEDL